MLNDVQNILCSLWFKMYMLRTKMKTSPLSKWYHPLLTHSFSSVPATLRSPTVVQRDSRRVRSV